MKHYSPKQFMRLVRQRDMMGEFERLLERLSPPGADAIPKYGSEILTMRRHFVKLDIADGTNEYMQLEIGYLRDEDDEVQWELHNVYLYENAMQFNLYREMAAKEAKHNVQSN